MYLPLCWNSWGRVHKTPGFPACPSEPASSPPRLHTALCFRPRPWGLGSRGDLLICRLPRSVGEAWFPRQSGTLTASLGCDWGSPSWCPSGWAIAPLAFPHSLWVELSAQSVPVQAPGYLDTSTEGAEFTHTCHCSP